MEQIRKVTDSGVLAALAHPLRRRLMDVLKVDGPSTASMLAERTDQAVANVSHHLRVLAGCDLILEAPELARDRRERWWRLGSTGVRWSAADFDDDPAGQAVASAALSINLDRQVGLVRAWQAVRDSQGGEWDEAPFSMDRWLWLTPAELAALGADLQALLVSYAERANAMRAQEQVDRAEAGSAEAGSTEAGSAEVDGPRRQPVFFFAHAVPGRP